MQRRMAVVAAHFPEELSPHDLSIVKDHLRKMGQPLLLGIGCFFFPALDDRSAGRSRALVQQLPGIDPQEQGEEYEDQAPGAPDDNRPRPASALVLDVLAFRL